jgi:hypothetical protein
VRVMDQAHGIRPHGLDHTEVLLDLLRS